MSNKKVRKMKLLNVSLDFKMMLKECTKGVSRVSQRCCKGVWKVFQRCVQGVSMVFKCVSRLFWRYINCITAIFLLSPKPCLKIVSGFSVIFGKYHNTIMVKFSTILVTTCTAFAPTVRLAIFLFQNPILL